ncbi:hypothetical protein [Aromatoleum toluclasticum]|uniref:hypothetical protein n=1 Tax=Aromatoleum toluclasticum TaxID=92003 RepID=UPI0012FBBFE6|nr:hypothetical protein [Aromatoleum toluclasticum]
MTGFSGELPDGQVSAPSPLGTPTLRGARVEMGKLSAASLLGVPSAIGRVIVSARISVPSPLSVTKVVGTVVRYELRGEVRDQGVLVNRRVRAYRRSDGAFIAEADTVAGLFALPVGFASAEYYLVPINLDPAATDYTPPCANRVTSVLAMDVAA